VGAELAVIGTSGGGAAAPKQEAPQQEAPQQEAPQQEAPKQEAPKQEAPKQEAPKQEAPEQEAPKQEQPAPAAPPSTQEAPDGDGSGAYVTPLVRRLAAERGVDLSTVSGSGVGGRIRKQDVLAAAEKPAAPAAAAPA